MVIYRSVAERIVSRSYGLSESRYLGIPELLELFGSENEIDHILIDDPYKRASRVETLAVRTKEVLYEYGVRRLRPPLIESSSVPDSYRGSFTVDPLAADDVNLLRAKFRLLPDIHNLLTTLPSRQFELLCGEILQMVGCANVTVTQESADDGVDAIAALAMETALATNTPLHRFAGGLSFLIYAQAKRYGLGNPVRQPEVQGLQGSWIGLRNEFHAGTLAIERATALRKADFRPADPVLLVLLTTSHFTAGSKNKGDAMGIIMLDGEQIAQLLIEGGFDLYDVSTDGELFIDAGKVGRS